MPDTTRSSKHEIESEDAQITTNYVSREQKNEAASDEQKGGDIVGRLFTTSMVQKPAGHDRPRATTESRNIFSAIFTPGDIDHSVSTTENLRLALALVVSLLVVTSYKGFIIGSAILSSIVGFKPLFFVLLTDLTIILGSVFLKQGIGHRRVKDARKTAYVDNEWPNDLGRIFEIGTMLHKVLSSAFMDCSICAVIVICGTAV
ncbi:hypothetical protein KSP40_PGU022631 [Platanthera guangdongensis]|uniref:Uncharacterized protein n=1 Tax=Platanthera guangdongensis TaxID=2320717 RepID=A0ABR2M575_9ASPA